MGGPGNEQLKGTVSGVPFGLRPRKQGVLYLPKTPNEALVKRMCGTDNYYMVGLDIIDGYRWQRWEKKSYQKKEKKAS